MEIEVDWSVVCLVCLQQEGDMRSLHEKDNVGLVLAEKIMKCTNIMIIGNFPEQICRTCEDDLEVAFRFKTNSESSYTILKSLLGRKYHKNSESDIKDIKIDYDSSFVHCGPDTINKNLNDIKDEEISFDTLSENDETNQIESDLRNIYAKEDDDFGENIYLANKTPKRHEKKPKLNSKFLCKTKTNTEDIQIGEKKNNNVKVKVINKNNKTSKPHKICEICGNNYKYQNALDSHMRRHRNEKPFSCEFCNRSFVANVELRRHMRVHTGQKPYTCHFCPRAFSDFGSRGKHERTHTGERPYSCETCGKTFAYAHVLSVHALTHTGEKKFKCEFCEKGFTKKSYLLAHTRNNHITDFKEKNVSNLT